MSSKAEQRLSPALKDWFDQVIIPALVREYLAGPESEKMLASGGEPFVESTSTRTATAEEGR